MRSTDLSGIMGLKLFFTGTFLFACISITQAQVAKTPVEQLLRSEVANAKTDTSRITLQLKLGKVYQEKDLHNKIYLDSALTLGRQCLQLSLTVKNSSKEGDSYDLLSWIYEKSGNREQAKMLEQKAIKAYNIAQDNNGLGRSLSQLATYFPYDDNKELAIRINYTKSALTAFNKSGNKLKEGETLQELGNLYLLAGEVFLAIKALKEGLAVYQSVNYKKLQGLNSMLGTCYNEVGDYNHAVEYGIQAIKVAQEVKDTTTQLCSIYNQVGRTYLDMDVNASTLSKAEEYFKDAVKVAIRTHDGDLQIVTLNLCNVLLREHKERTAIIYLKNLHKAFDRESTSMLYCFFLKCYTQLKQYDLAGRYYDKLIDIFQHMDELAYAKEVAYSSMVPYLLQIKKYDQAKAVIDKLNIVGNYHHTKKIRILVQRMSFLLDSAQGRYLSAIKHSQQERILRDSLLNEQKNKNISQLEVEYETEKKERELKLKTKDVQLLTKQSQLQQASLQKDVILRRVTIAGIVMLAALLALLYNRYQIKQKNNVQLEAKQAVINNKNTSLERLVGYKDRLLEEKEWLLKEIHHRVKNNLQIVISLLNTQSNYLNNSEAQGAIRESQHRMHSISLIHQKLYQSDNLARIDMIEYISELVQYLQESFDMAKKIEIILEIEPIKLDVVQAVPIGLILNEAITNAIKYAFSPEEVGRITIILDESVQGTLVLTIIDNGRGLPDDFNTDNCTTLGMSLIRGLSKQLHGEFTLITGSGLTLQVTVPTDPILNKDANRLVADASLS
jgi:two-component sensor histidine kinase